MSLSEALYVPNTDRHPLTGAKLKRLAINASLVVAILAGSAAGYEYWQSNRYLESTNDAYVGGDVTVIAPQVAGFIAKLNVSDNQSVHSGDVLIKLDDRDYRAAVQKADATVAAKAAAISNFDSLRSLQASIIAQAQSDIAFAAADIDRSLKDQTRYEQLGNTGAISRQQVERAEAAYKQALASGDKARAEVAAAERQLAVIASEKRQAEADLAEAKSERDIAELNLGYTELRAPVDGVVGNRSAREGAYATVGAELLSLVPARGLWIDANFKEDQLARIHPGQNVTIIADTLPGETFRGHVASIAPATGATFSVLPAENATGNFTKIVQRVPVRIVLDDNASQFGRLRPGLSTTVTVDTRGAP